MSNEAAVLNYVNGSLPRVREYFPRLTGNIGW